MTKGEFIDRLILAADTAKRFAASLDYVDKSLPDVHAFSLFKYDDPEGARGPEGTIKFFGGRHLKPEELNNIKASRVGSLLWVSGTVPAWININVSGYTESTTEFELMFSRELIRADVDTLPPDINMEPGNNLVPFRIRGPSLEQWRSHSHSV